MDGTEKRRDFRRATISVPPSALASLAKGQNDHHCHSLYSSPLRHRFSPWGQIDQDENDTRRNQTLKNIKFINTSNNNSSSNQLRSSSTADFYSIHNDPSSVDKKNTGSSLYHRRQSTGSFYWEAMRIHSYNNNVGSGLKSSSPLKEANDLNISGSSDDGLRNDFNILSHHNNNTVDNSNDSGSNGGKFMDPPFSDFASQRRSPFPSAATSEDLKSNGKNYSSVLLNLSTVLFGNRFNEKKSRSRDDSSIGLKLKRQNPFAYENNESREGEEGRGRGRERDSVLTSVSSTSASQPNTREKESSFLMPSPSARSSSPRPISPMGTLLLRTEF